MKKLIPEILAAAALILAGTAGAGQFRVGAHAGYLNPKANEFDNEMGVGAILKYKFTDTLGIEIGADYYRWKVDEVADMPYSVEDPSVSYDETDKVYPLYCTVMFFSPTLEKRARAYLGLGAGFYQIEADIEGSTVISDGSTSYPVSITGDIDGQVSYHIAAGADFELSPYIYLNVEARYVFTKIDREMTFSNPEIGTTTVKDEEDFDNWQVRLGLEYAF